LVDPVVLKTVNITVGALSGVLVPASGALLALATANFVLTTSPEAATTLQAASQPSAPQLAVIGGGGALIASLFTFIKFLIKPMLSTATGMAATTAPPAVFKTAENAVSVILLTTMYVLGSINPWLLVVAMSVVSLLLLAILIFALYQLWKLGQGIGKVIRLLQIRPKAGLAVILEPFVWGAGWLMLRGGWGGVGKMAAWFVSLGVIWFILPGLFLVILPPLSPVIPFAATFGAIYFIGGHSARTLLRSVEAEGRPSERSGAALALV
jgi:hypothetical protein